MNGAITNADLRFSSAVMGDDTQVVPEAIDGDGFVRGESEAKWDWRWASMRLALRRAFQVA